MSGKKTKNQSSNHHVVPHPNGWAVRRQGNQHPTRVVGTQHEAIGIARGRTQQTGGGEMIIHRPNGQIRQKNTIGKPDPYPPEG